MLPQFQQINMKYFFKNLNCSLESNSLYYHNHESWLSLFRGNISFKAKVDTMTVSTLIVESRHNDSRHNC